MVNIVLCCASGMSTTLLVEKMKKAAQEKNLKAKIWSVSEKCLKDVMQRADIVLLGPQVGYVMDCIDEKATSIPIAHINLRDYGMLDGNAVLSQAMLILKNNGFAL